MFEWSREVDSNKDAYGSFINWVNESILPYLSKNVALKNVDKYSPMEWKEKSKFADGFDKVLNDREFENLVDNNLYHRILLKDGTKKLEKIIDDIIKKTK